MEINGIEVDVDLAVVLLECGIKDFRDRGTDYRAHCPNHSERTPSWDISKDQGIFNCFGCGYSGNVLTLLKDFHPDVGDEIEAIAWLFNRFSVMAERKPVELNLDRERKGDFLDESVLDAYDFRHSFLYERGLTEPALQAFRVGYCKERQAITFPWRDRKGRLRFIQYRPIKGGRYLYDVSKDVKRRTLYALDKVVKAKVDRVALVEGPIDAIWCWQNGVPAVAIGSAFIHPHQATELALAGVKSVDLFLDNPYVDKAGQQGKEHARRVLKLFRLREVVYPNKAKDPNELSAEEISNLSYRVPLDF